MDLPARRKGWVWYRTAELLQAVQSIDAPIVSVRRHGASRASVIKCLQACGELVAVASGLELVEFASDGQIMHCNARTFGVPVVADTCDPPAAKPVKKPATPRKRRRVKGAE